MKGARPDRYGLRVYVKVGTQQREKRFPKDASLKAIKAWRDETRVALRALKAPSDPAGSLSADLVRYLGQVSSMPTYAQREAHLRAWLAELGPHTPRTAVTPERIRTVLQDWRATMSAATCNKRRTGNNILG